MHNAQAVELLLSRLTIEAPELAKVKQAADNRDLELAAQELLAYYRSRDGIKHPIDRHGRAGLLGKAASQRDITVADNALQHIFVGQPSYPPHFCGDDIDWTSSPVPDREWVWQLNRMAFWGAMGRVYWHTGDEKYVRVWAAQMTDWIAKNPVDGERRYRYAWRPIEAGIRGHSWTGHFQYFVDSPSVTPDVLVAFLNSCHDHADFLMEHYTKRSNWALMEAEGLAFIALTFPEFKDSGKWRDEAFTRFGKEIVGQVYPDGHQRELALGYHIGCIDWFMRTLEMAGMNGQKDAFPPSYLQIIEKMCAVVMKLGLPDGSKTQFGDSWAGKPGDTWRLLAKWAKLFDRQDFLYVATAGREGEAPGATAFALEDSGFYSMRSGWHKDAICLVLKCGPDGGSHSQPDNGTFELYAGGRNLMPDSGCYIYSGDAEGRAWFRQTRVHQTLTLNGENTAYAPRLLHWQTGPDLDLLVVENASYPNLTHRRAVAFVDKRFFVIVDEAVGDAAGDIRLHFQLAPGKAHYDAAAYAVRSDFADGWNVRVLSMAQEGMTLEEEEGWVSFVYTKKEPRPAFCYRLAKGAGEPGVRFITVVAPYEDAPPDIAVKLRGQPEVGSARMELEVTANGTSKTIVYELPK